MDATLVLGLMAVLSAWALTSVAIWRWGPGRAKPPDTLSDQTGVGQRLVEQREGDLGSLRVTDVVACSLFPDGPLTLVA